MHIILVIVSLMKSTYRTPYSLLLVVFAHLGVLAAVLYGAQKRMPEKIEPPSIQGVLIASQPVTKVEPQPVPPPPQEQPQPKPKIPLPEAPASERAVHQEPELQPEPAPPEPRKLAEPSAAPVTPPSAEASGLNNPAPVYPASSRKLREEGVVLLEILVKADGSIGEMRLKKSSGYNRLDESAQRAVKNWHFMPAKRDGEPIDFWYELPIEFSLNQ